MEKGGIEDLFKKQVPRTLYRRYNATKHVITFYNGSNLFFGHVKTDADLLQYQGAEFLFIGWEELTQFSYEDNLVYRDDANYIASLQSIVDPVLRQAWFASGIS
jgi:hypothetical protein